MSFDEKSAFVSHPSINCIRIDFYPDVLVKDLDIGKARKHLGLERHGVIKLNGFTLKYTSSSTISAYIKKPYNKEKFLRLFDNINALRVTLNKFKENRVKYFERINLCNIQGAGKFDYTFNADFWKEINFTADVEFCIGHNSIEPQTPCSRESLNIHQAAFIVVETDTSSRLTLHRRGSFSLISNSLQSYRKLTEILIKIRNHVITSNCRRIHPTVA